MLKWIETTGRSEEDAIAAALDVYKRQPWLLSTGSCRRASR